MRDEQLPTSGGSGAAKPISGIPAERPPRVRSEQLLGAGTELVIEHHGRDYRLRITQNGKLILTA
jgi:hemin uptake protein HemP